MTAAKYSASYAPEYHSLWHILSLGEEPRITLPMGKKEATAFRFKFYNYLRTKRTEALLAPPELQAELSREIMAVTRYSLRVTPEGFVAEFRSLGMPQITETLDALLSKVLLEKAEKAKTLAPSPIPEHFTPSHETPSADPLEDITARYFGQSSAATPPPANPVLDAISDTGTAEPRPTILPEALFARITLALQNLPADEHTHTMQVDTPATAAHIANAWNASPPHAALAIAAPHPEIAREIQWTKHV